ncbi:MAG TPA: DUF58 domain-containing protein [Planktothrix sp.]
MSKSQSLFRPVNRTDDEHETWAIRGLRFSLREDKDKSLSVFLELRAFVVAALVPILYIFAGETANQWFYLLTGGVVSALFLGFFLPLFQVLDVSTACSIPQNSVNNESVLVKVTLARKWRYGLFSKLLPVKWLLVRANMVSHLGRSSVVRPMVVEFVGHEAWVFAATAPLQRGLYRLDSVELYSCFPFGLTWWCRKFESNKNLLDPASEGAKPMVTVYPPIEQVEGNFLYKIRASTDSPMGLLSNRRTTNSVSSSVRGLREYQHGDSPRLIHWPSSARAGRLLVREFEAEGLPGFDLLLNLTTPWRSDDQFELAVSVTYSLLQLGFKLGGAPELYLIPNVDLEPEYLPSFMSDMPALPFGLARSSHLLARVMQVTDRRPEYQVVDLKEESRQALMTIRPAGLFDPAADPEQDESLLYKVELAVVPRSHDPGILGQGSTEVHMPVHEFGIVNRRTGKKSTGRVISTIETLGDVMRL